MAQIGARTTQDVAADLKTLRALLKGQVRELKERINEILVQEKILAAKAELLRSIPEIGPVSAAKRWPVRHPEPLRRPPPP